MKGMIGPGGVYTSPTGGHHATRVNGAGDRCVFTWDGWREISRVEGEAIGDFDLASAAHSANLGSSSPLGELFRAGPA